ncbi:MAG: prepilin-type N-terminal cleavage/methylation domain-containing protein, partial [Opitutus sp.]
PLRDCRRLRGSHLTGGFTLTEVMIATALSLIVLGGVLSAFLMIGRTSVNSTRYSQNEAEVRRALELFGQDARLASDIRWTNDHNLTLTVARPTNPTARITYAYDDDPTSDTYRCFYQVEATSDKKVLAREVSDLSFQRFKLEQPGVTLNAAANDLETKQLQLTLRSSRRSATTTVASQAAISACYILRNKRVSN